MLWLYVRPGGSQRDRVFGKRSLPVCLPFQKRVVYGTCQPVFIFVVGSGIRVGINVGIALKEVAAHRNILHIPADDGYFLPAELRR